MSFFLPAVFIPICCFPGLHISLQLKLYVSKGSGMAKFYWIWSLLLTVAGMVSLLFNGNSGAVDLIFSEMHSKEQNVHVAMATSRKLKDDHGFPRVRTKSQTVGIEDYDPIDPVPSSKTSVKHGPIQHGSPLIPYLPRPSPPDYPPFT